MKAHGFCNTFGANHKTSLLESNFCADANEPRAVMSSSNAFHSLPHLIPKCEWATTQKQEWIQSPVRAPKQNATGKILTQVFSNILHDRQLGVRGGRHSKPELHCN